LSLRFLVTNLFLVFAFLAPLCAEEEIQIELSTKVTLEPIYLGQPEAEHASLPTPYLASLRKILAFDLHHCGYSKVAEIDTLLEKALRHHDPNVAFNLERWEKSNVSYVLKMDVFNKKLDVYLFNAKAGTLKKFEGIPLSGELNIDRRQMHKLSDAIVKTLFGVEGVSNSRILYSLQIPNTDPNRTEWKAEIWECDYDGHHPHQVTYEQGYSITPTFIPSEGGSDHYLYVNYRNGQPKIYQGSLKGRTGKPLLNLRGNQLLPTVSKQRDKIAFISDAGGRADLFVQPLDANGSLVEKPEQLFSYPRATQASPTFSPDGSKIAFVSDKDGTPRIYIIASNAKNHKRQEAMLISKKNRENTCPSWSPDGKKIAYSAKTNGIRQIWIYDLEAEEEIQLTSGTGNKENPCWAFDSLHLVFNSTDPDASELYLVNLNQPEVIQITSGTGKKHYPTWGKR
jgi:TolB protein